MPYLNGHQVARSLYESPQTNKIPIVIITATSGNANQVDLEKICQGYLHKPVSRSQLVEVLKRIFDRHDPNKTERENTEAIATTSLQFPELIVKLRREEETSWVSLCQTLKSSDLRAFITRLEAWGEEHQCQTLQEYTQRLKLQMENFDWGNLPQTVNEFPQVARSLEAKGG